jgi:hypothetical protein
MHPLIDRDLADAHVSALHAEAERQRIVSRAQSPPRRFVRRRAARVLARAAVRLDRDAARARVIA